MSHTVWCDDAAIATLELPPGRFVACRIATTPAYATIADTIVDATRAFLEVGVFHDVRQEPVDAERDASDAAFARASRLRLALTDAAGQPTPVRFINLLAVDGEVVALVSRDTGAGREALATRHRAIPPANGHELLE